jgi:hypothetical protein
MRKTLVILSGVMLIIFACILICHLFLAQLAFASRGAAIEKWHLILLLSIPIFIFSGIALFSFKEWARKLALVSYVLGLSHIVFDYIEKYLRIAVFYKYPFNFFNIDIVYIIIVLFFIAELFLSKELFRGGKDIGNKIKKNRFAIELAVIISILTLFGSLYLSVINLLYKQHEGQTEARKNIELVTPKINNDPRFKMVSLFVDGRGYPVAKGIVKNEEDWRSLKDILSSYNFPALGWVGIDSSDIMGTPWSRDIHPIILVNIGSIKKTYKEQAANLLKNNGIVNYLHDSQSSSDICYIYISPAKREQAINLLKQDPSLVGKYLPKSDQSDYMKVGKENFVDIGFIEMSHIGHIESLLHKNSIEYEIKSAQYPGYNVCYIYVSPAKREQAINLLKQDPELMAKEEYCPK